MNLKKSLQVLVAAAALATANADTSKCVCSKPAKKGSDIAKACYAAYGGIKAACSGPKPSLTMNDKCRAAVLAVMKAAPLEAKIRCAKAAGPPKQDKANDAFRAAGKHSGNACDKECLRGFKLKATLPRAKKNDCPLTIGKCMKDCKQERMSKTFPKNCDDPQHAKRKVKVACLGKEGWSHAFDYSTDMAVARTCGKKYGGQPKAKQPKAKLPCKTRNKKKKKKNRKCEMCKQDCRKRKLQGCDVIKKCGGSRRDLRGEPSQAATAATGLDLALAYIARLPELILGAK